MQSTLRFSSSLFVLLTIIVLSSIVFSSYGFAYDVLELDIKTQKKTQTVRIKLLDGQGFAPKHVARIKQLTEEGAYDNMAIHRAIPGFMIQTGDVKYGKMDNYNDARVGTGSSKYPNLYLEPSAQPFEAGIVGMARGRYAHSANSQFFIMTGYHPNLNKAYSVVGVVIEGLDFLQNVKMGNGNINAGKVENPDYVVKARIVDGKS